MALDPHTDLISRITGVRRQATVMGDHNRRLESLERNYIIVQTGSGAPTSTPQDGVLYLDITNLRLYARANGAWHYAALT